MIYQFGTITWASAHYFLYVLPLLVFACFLLAKKVWWQRRMATLLGALPSVQVTRQSLTGDVMHALQSSASRKLLRNFSLFKKVLKALLLVFALLCLALALGRPQWDDTQQVVAQEGRDVLIALDISRSMLAGDSAPSRLEVAKKKIKELVGRFNAERVCLMVFSGAPVIQCPFTTDKGAFMSFLDLVDVESISSGTTALDKALQKAVDTFKSMPTRKHKIMIIFTDGEDFSSFAQGMNEQIKNLGLSVFTVGVGTSEGAPIPLPDEQGKPQGHLKDKNGTIVITRLNEPLLKKLSAQTGARYLRATADESDMNQLILDVNHFEKEKFDDRIFSAKHEKYFIFAAISFICFLIEWLL